MKENQLISISRNIDHNDYVLYILLVCLIILCISKFLFPKTIKNLNNRTEYLDDVDDNSFLFSIITHSVIIFLISSVFVSYYNPPLNWLTENFLLRVIFCAVIITGIYTTKTLLSTIYMRYICPGLSFKLLIKNSNYINSRVFLILLFAHFLYYYTVIPNYWIISTIFFLILIYKFWEIFLRQRYQIKSNYHAWYYNILYLCTLEFLPIIVLAKYLKFWQ